MPLLDYATSLIGYPEHELRASQVLACSHCTVHEALRLAEHMGLFTGWILADAAPAQLVGMPGRQPRWAVLATLFVERRVAFTEGPVGGEMRFVAATQAQGEPPSDQDLITWAESAGRPWLRAIDNEIVFWGGLDPHQQRLVLRWFLQQAPLQQDTAIGIEAAAADALLATCHRHGLTRNAALVDADAGRQQLWAGRHEECPLPPVSRPLLSQVDQGFLLQCQDQSWGLVEQMEDCPLDDHRGRRVS
ncbi:MAG: hypothetical protein ACOCXA_01725 [Planctomycetota bacterium]